MKGKKVLIVEDCHLLAVTLEDMLTEAGAEVVAIAPSVAIALKAVDRYVIDIACLDINLGFARPAFRSPTHWRCTAYRSFSCRHTKQMSCRPRTGIDPSSARPTLISNW